MQISYLEKDNSYGYSKQVISFKVFKWQALAAKHIYSFHVSVICFDHQPFSKFGTTCAKQHQIMILISNPSSSGQT